MNGIKSRRANRWTGEKVTLPEENKMNTNEKSCWIRVRQSKVE